MDGQRELMDIIECRVAFATEKWVGTDYERGRRKSSNIYANIKLKQHKSFHQNEEFSQLQFIKEDSDSTTRWKLQILIMIIRHEGIKPINEGIKLVFAKK